MKFDDLMRYISLKYLVVPKAPVIDVRRKRIACIGDSITFGDGVQGKREKTWEYFLENMLGGEYQVLNYGINARTLLKKGDYPYEKEQFYRVSQACGAEHYIIMLGTNDSKPYNWNRDNYRRELGDFLAIYKLLPQSPKLTVMLPPTCFKDPALGIVQYDIRQEVIRDEVCPVIGEVCAEMKIPTIDLQSFTAGHPEWFCDGVHPNETGNRAIAAYIYSCLRTEKE